MEKNTVPSHQQSTISDPFSLPGDAALLLLALQPLFENNSLTKNPLAQVVERLPSVVPCHHAAAWVAAGVSGSLLRCVCAVHRASFEGVNESAFAPDMGLLDQLIDGGGWQAKAKKSAPIVEDATTNAAFDNIEMVTDAWIECFGESLPTDTLSLLVAPLITGGELLGVLTIASPEAEAFSPLHRSLLSLLSTYAALAAQNVRLHEIQCLAAERQQMLDQISTVLQKTLDLETLIGRIFDEVNKALHAEAQSIWLVDDEARTIACRFATGPGAVSVKEVSVPLGEGIVGKTVAHQKSYLITDAQKDVRHSRRADNKTGLTTRSLLSVPMVREGRAIGAIQAINKQAGFICIADDGNPQSGASGEFFTPDDMELLRAIADIAALAIENARLFADLQASYDTTLDALTAALDCRDHETEGHCRRVSEYSVRLAQQVGLAANEIQVLRRGALIHDIGKIGVPDSVLHKNGPLTGSEWEVMQKHPQAGWEMLQNIPYLHEEVQLVLTHQERWDGKGYPFGLVGEAIPLNARLFAIADTFDAILSDRPYRRGRPYEDAAQIISGEAEKQFDPRLVEAFLSVPPHEWEALRHSVMATISPPSRSFTCS